MPSLTAVSLFSGCGGFDWGAAQAGVKVIWANDLDPHAAAAYRSVFPATTFELSDIKKIKEFPKADILIGCYPCTGFSVAARRRTVGAETRDLRAVKGNYLFEEFLRAIKQVQPRYLFVENVRGMVTADKGWFMRAQLAGFHSHGYKLRILQLCAADFGVAQERTRIFIIGIRKDVRKFSYPSPEVTHGPKGTLPHQSLRDCIGGDKNWSDDAYFDHSFHGHYLTRNRKRSWDRPSYTIVAHAHHVPLHPMGEPMQFVAKDQWALVGDENRRLSWRECAAIQGLPESAVPSGTLEDKYRVIGNAVPPTFGRVLLAPVCEFERS